MGAWMWEWLSQGMQLFILLLLYLLSLGWVASFFTSKYFLICSILLLIVDFPLLLKVHLLYMAGGVVLHNLRNISRSCYRVWYYLFFYRCNWHFIRSKKGFLEPAGGVLAGVLFGIDLATFKEIGQWHSKKS
jgi:hypothetical protein